MTANTALLEYHYHRQSLSFRCGDKIFWD